MFEHTKTGKDFPARKFVAAPAVIFALITLVIYLPALKNGFVNWDDFVYVHESFNERAIDFSLLRWIFTSRVAANWHPLTMLSIAIDYSLWGLNPLGYHLTNIVIHALNTCLVYLLAVRLSWAAEAQSGSTANRNRAAITGAAAAFLFGLHPIHVESVAWVSERKDVLSAFFFLLSALSYVKYAEAGSARRTLHYAASLIFLILSLMSKPMAVTLPIVLLILDLYPLGRLKAGSLRAAVLEKMPFFIISAAFSILTVLTQREAQSLASRPVTERAFISLRGFIFYLYKTIAPADLAPRYPPPARPDLLTSEFALYLITFASITALCVFLIRRQRIFAAAWFYYVATLIPVIGIVPVGSQPAADRYMYLPSIGPFMLLGAGAGYLFARSGRRAALGYLAAIMLIAAAAMSYLTLKQISVWKDTISLWEHQTGIYPDNTPAITYYNLGEAYKSRGEYAKALNAFSKAIEINPADAQAYNNRGAAYLIFEDYRRAAEDFERSLSLDPANAPAYFNLGLAYSKTGDKDKAIFYFKKAKDSGVREAEEYIQVE